MVQWHVAILPSLLSVADPEFGDNRKFYAYLLDQLIYSMNVQKYCVLFDLLTLETHMTEIRRIDVIQIKILENNTLSSRTSMFVATNQWGSGPVQCKM